MTYFTAVETYPVARKMSRRDLHAIIAAATDGRTPRTLWAMPHPSLLIIQSAEAPDSAILSSLGSIVAQRPYRSIFCVGAQVVLAGIVNPTRAKKGRDDSRGRRIPVAAADLPSWFQRRIPAVEMTEIVTEPLEVVRTARPGMRMTHAAAGLSAIGTVIDADALEASLLAGVGAGKAYGFGLILARQVDR